MLHGRPLVHLAVTPEHLARVAADPVQLGLYLRVDIRYACVVPLAAAGLLSPVLAGAAMAFSSVGVVGSALLLRRWRPAGAQP